MDEIYNVENLYFAKKNYISCLNESFEGVSVITPIYYLFQKNDKRFIEILEGVVCYPDEFKYLFLICLLGGSCVVDVTSFKEAFPEYKENTISLVELKLKLDEMNSKEIKDSILKRA